MSDTPETDAVAEKINFGVDIDFARKLERERDELLELLASEKITRNHIIKRSVEVERERDEALMDRGNGDIATMTINHYERILRERNEWAAMCGRYKQERDEVKEHLSAAKHFLNKYIAERDEARVEIQRLRLDAQKEAEHHDRMVKELEELYDKLKS